MLESSDSRKFTVVTENILHIFISSLILNFESCKYMNFQFFKGIANVILKDLELCTKFDGTGVACSLWNHMTHMSHF